MSPFPGEPLSVVVNEQVAEGWLLDEGLTCRCLALCSDNIEIVAEKPDELAKQAFAYAIL